MSGVLCTTKGVHCYNTKKALKELKNRKEEGDEGAEDKMIVNIKSLKRPQQ